MEKARTKTYQTFTNEKKIEICEFYLKHKAEGIPMRAVGEKFSMDHFCHISTWLRQLGYIRNGSPEGKRVKTQPFTKFPMLEKELMQWLISMRQHGQVVLRATIEKRARELAVEMGLAQFKCGQGWWDGFRQRNGLAYRKINASSIKPLEKEAELVGQYLDDLEPLLRRYNPDSIFNFDDTRFEWDMSSKHTYDFKGAKRVVGVHSAKVGHAITVLLMIRADGLRLLLCLSSKSEMAKSLTMWGSIWLSPTTPSSKQTRQAI
ncbi:unnamed protein product [Blepharisma stoltei]|uniref:HTH CENPB-type domain-containing protein n=1 Tax=Blepharisma stoltei TaxID=1481888 RepID=A0AAU9JDV9_9CILI|nr:unnamed protein product [Blepharisma stoltei]